MVNVDQRRWALGWQTGPKSASVLRPEQEGAFNKVGMPGAATRALPKFPDPAALRRFLLLRVQCSAALLFDGVFLDRLPALVRVGSRSHPPSTPAGQTAQHPIPYITAARCRPSFIRSLSVSPFLPTHTPAPPSPSPWLSPALSPHSRTSTLPPPACNGRLATRRARFASDTARDHAVFGAAQIAPLSANASRPSRFA